MQISKMKEDSDDDIWEYSSLKRFKKSESTRKRPKSSKDGGAPVRPSLIENEMKRKPMSLTRKSQRRNRKIAKQEPSSEPESSLPSMGKTDQCLTNGQVTTKIEPDNISSTQSTDSSLHSGSQNNKSKCTPTKPRKIYEGFCPLCQMPFSLLLIQSPNWHVTECSNIVAALEDKPECAEGIYCDVTIPSHYHKFRHTALALSRDCGQLTSFPTEQQNGFETIRESSASSRKLFERAQLEPHSFKCDEEKEKPLPFVEKYLPAEEDIKMPGKIEPNDPTIADIDYMSDEDIFDEKNDTSAEIRNKVGDMLSQETIFKKQNCSRDGSERLNDVSPVNTPSKGFSVDTVFPNSEIEKLFTDEQPWALDIDENCIESSDIPISADSTQHTGGRNSADTQNISTLQTTEGALVECKGQKFTQDVMQTKQTSIYSFFKPSDEIRKQVKYNVASAASKTAKPKDVVSEQQTQRLQRHFLGARSDKSNKERVEEKGSVAPIAKGRWKTTCPFYKKIPGTSFTVDAFCYGVVPGCSAYFLSHFHYDHYRGLSKHFKQPIYCSQVTSNLVKKQIRVEDKYLISLPTDRPCHVHGVQVTLMEANHCPGAVLFFFELPNGRAILHTGDFRADPSMVEHPALKGRKIHQLYLDTTYCDPSYAFPPQQDVVSFAVSLAGKHICEHPNSLIVCGTYTIGKERIFIAIAEAIQSRVCVTREKYRILQCLDDNKLDGMLTTKWTEAKVHVLPMGKLKLDTLQEHLRSFKGQFDNILALEPTGWTHSGKTLSLNNIKPKVKKKGITIYGVPYSEHSSYTELKNFVQALQPDQILPTVNNGNPTSRRKMESLFKSWLQEKKVHSQQILLSTWCKN